MTIPTGHRRILLSILICSLCGCSGTTQGTFLSANQTLLTYAPSFTATIGANSSNKSSTNHVNKAEVEPCLQSWRSDSLGCMGERSRCMESIGAFIDQEVRTGEELKELLGRPDMIASTEGGTFVEYEYILKGYCETQNGSIAVRLDNAKSLHYQIKRANDSIIGSYVVVLD